MIHATIVAAALLLAVEPLLAQNKQVYRCEGPSGRVSYSDEPCKGGVALANDDARSNEQRKAAADVATREERLANKLTGDRRQAEKSAGSSSSGPALIPYSAAEKAAKEQPTVKKKRAPKKKGPRVREKTQA